MRPVLSESHARGLQGAPWQGSVENERSGPTAALQDPGATGIPGPPAGLLASRRLARLPVVVIQGDVRELAEVVEAHPLALRLRHAGDPAGVVGQVAGPLG